MMKKVIKKLLAALLAVAMVCAMAIPAFAGTEGDITTWHSFSAFQIFKGDVEGNDIKDFKISNVTWGSNIFSGPIESRFYPWHSVSVYRRYRR